MNLQEIVKEIRALKRGWTGRKDEARILDLLEAAPDASLDVILRELDVDILVRNFHNRVNGPDHLDQLLKLLTVDRLHDLSLQTRADIVWALQKGRTHRPLEMAIRNIILGSTGEELRRLRNVLNLSGTYRDLPRLVFTDIDDPAIRAEIIDHIAAHQVPTDEIKVLSDIDDTVFARLHDKRYPGKTRYPGVLAFFNALDHAPDGSGESGDLTFVSARPGLIAGIVSRFTRRSLRKAGIRQHTILLGSLLALRSHHYMARRKMQNIRRYHQLFPEYGIVFVGDSGQGDVQVGREMLQELGDAVRAVFIHDVKETALNQPDAHHEPGIAFFNSYIAAAAAAWQAGVISSGQALGVGEAAISDLEALIAIPAKVREARLAEHRADLAALHKILRESDTGKP